MNKKNVYNDNAIDMSIQTHVQNLRSIVGMLFFDNDNIGDTVVRSTKEIQALYCPTQDCAHPFTELMFIDLWLFHYITNSTFYSYFLNSTLSSVYDYDLERDKEQHLMNRVQNAPLYTRTSFLYHTMSKFTLKFLIEIHSLFESDENSLIRPALFYTYKDVVDVIDEFIKPSFYNIKVIPKGSLLNPILLCYLYDMFLASSYEELYIKTNDGDIEGVDNSFNELMYKYKDSLLYKTQSHMYCDLFSINNVYERTLNDTSNVSLLKQYVGIDKNESCLISMLSFQARAQTLYFIFYKELFSFL